MAMSLSTKTYTYDQLTKQYKDFYQIECAILVDGTDIIKENAIVTTISVETSSDQKADWFSFTVTDVFDEEKADFTKSFQLGKAVEIKMGYAGSTETVFMGYISSVDYEFPAEDAPSVTVRGMDMTFLMMIGQQYTSWGNQTYTDVVADIAQKYSAKVVSDDSGDVIPMITQDNIDDYTFLKKLAKITGFDFFIVGNTLYFRKPFQDKTAVLTLERKKGLLDFSVDTNIAGQYGEVVVRSWDEKKQEVIEGKSGSVNKLGSNSKTGKDLINTLSKNVKEYVYVNIENQTEAQKIADALMNRRALKLVGGRGSCIGLPVLQAGRYLQIAGVGKQLSQLYYLKSVTHTISESGFVTTFEVEGNAV